MRYLPSASRLSRAILGALALLGASFVPGNAQTEPTWAQFRGPDVRGVSTASGVFPTPGNVSLEVGWKKTLGSAYSCISVANNTVVTFFSDGKSDVAVALDAKTGAEKWRVVLDKTYEGHDGSHNGPIATPLIVDSIVVALAPRGRMVGLDLPTGKVIWDTHLVEDHQAVKPHYGFSTSPVLIAGAMIVQLGAPEAALASFNPKTGELIWKAGDDIVGYETAIPFDFSDGLQIVAAGMQKVMGVDPKNGSVLWEHTHEGTGGRGAMSMVPLDIGQNRLFLCHDDNSSRVLTVQKSAEGYSSEVAWENRHIRNTYNIPVYYQGHIYSFSSRVLTCVNADTGEQMWRSRAPGDGFTIIVDGHLVIVTKEGELHIIRATPEGYQPRASLALFSDLSWNTPGFDGESIYVRSLGEIARVNISSSESVTLLDEENEAIDSDFSRFLNDLAAASNKEDLVDRFLAKHPESPIIEDNRSVHFYYRGNAEDVAIGGDMIGARQEQAMARVAGTVFFYYSTTLEPDARVGYVLIKDYEEITDPRNPRTDTTTVYGKDMEVAGVTGEMPISWVAMPEWEAPQHLVPSETHPRGTVTQEKFKSEGSDKEITVDVYLPHGYENSETTRYPVAYVHGGKEAMERGKMVTSLDRLIGDTVAPLIVVFIHEAFRGVAPPYVGMVVGELIPFIDKSFRTIQDKNARASLGASFAGTASFYTGFMHPEVVGRVAGQSCMMLEAYCEPLFEMLPSASETPLHIYLDWCTYDVRNPHEAWDMAVSGREFAATLKEKGYKLAGGEAHDGTGWSSWRNRTNDVLEAMFPLEKP